MGEPMTVGAAVAAARNVIGLVGGSWARLREARPKYRVFWEAFEAELKQEAYDVPWQRIEDRYWLNPEFIGRVQLFIELGDGQARSELEGMFRQDLVPPEGSRYDKEALIARVIGALVKCAYRVDDSAGRVGQQVVGQLSAKIDALQRDLANRMSEETSSGSAAVSGDVRLVLAKLEQVSVDVRGLAGDRAPVSRDQTDVAPSRPISSLIEQAAEGKSPQELVAELRLEDSQHATLLDELMASEGATAVVRMVRARQHLIADDTIAFLVTVARIVAHEGAFSEAEEAYLWASQLPGISDNVRARQLVRASGMAQVYGAEDRSRAHLDAARELAPDHPGVAVAEARRSRDGTWALSRLADVVPENDHERALLHATRAQAHLALENESEARNELALARAADAAGLAVRELESIVALVEAQRRLGRGENPDKEALLKAGEEFHDLRTGLDTQARWEESALLAARSAEAYALAGDRAQAGEVLGSVARLDRVSSDARLSLGRTALLSQRADLALIFIDDADESPAARLLQANAHAIASDDDGRNAALDTFAELLSCGDDEVQVGAAFALLIEATEDQGVEWSEAAATVARGRNAAGVAILRAEHLRLHGELEEAESELLPHVSDRSVLRVLRDVAAERSDWKKARDRSRAIIRDGPTARDRYVDAEILLRGGDSTSAKEEFLRLARDSLLPDDLRDSAYGEVAAIVGEHRNYAAVRELADEWHVALPTSANATWNYAFALARLSEHRKAYELLTESGLEPATTQQAQLAAEILNREAPKDQVVREIEALSTRFGQPEPLEAILLATALEVEQAGVQVSDELATELAHRLNSFPDRFPNSRFMWRVDAPKTAEEFDALMRATHGESAAAQNRALQGITDAVMPVNALAAVSPGGYVGRSWSRLWSLPLGLALSALDDHERTAASEALGGAAVWDPSSIYVAGLLGDAMEHRVREALPGSLIANQTLEDADAAASGLGPSGSEIGYDPDAGQAFRKEISSEEVQAERAAVERSLALAKSLDVQPPLGPDTENEFVDLMADDGVADAWKVLVGTFLLARRTKQPIFSDDRAVRQLARDQGIATFGTLSLLDALADRGLLSPEDRAAARAHLAARGAWGLRFTGQEMVDEAERIGWENALAVTGGLEDRAAWRAEPAKRLSEVVHLLAAVHQRAPELLGAWLRKLLRATHAAVPQMPHSWWARWLLVQAWGVAERDPVMPDKAFQTLVDETKRLPLAYRTLGFDPVLAGIAELLACVVEQPETVRSFVFFSAVRRLRLLDQMRAWDRFVAPAAPSDGGASPGRAPPH
jgi:hypothetical protein